MAVAKKQAASKKTQKPAAKLFQLKISLIDSPLPIWRRIVVRSDLPLALVHEVFQITMGWWNSHLNDFEANGKHYGDVEAAKGTRKLEDDTKFTLSDLVEKPGDEFVYNYDPADSWRHRVVLEGQMDASGSAWAYCLVGRRACPPEDLGGIEAYRDFLEVIEDPFNEAREEQLEWVGGDFDPDSFDIRGVNLRLILLQEQIAGTAN